LDFPFEIDAIDTSKNIAVEFVSKEDMNTLSEKFNTNSTHDLADSLTAEVNKSGNDITFKAFHDTEYGNKDYSKEKLVEQIQEFLDLLKNQGLI
jgi:hypothetical protein